MTVKAEGEESRTLAKTLIEFGITGPDHPALNDRESLGRYLVKLNPPEDRVTVVSLDRWREQRRTLSQAGVDRLRAAIGSCPQPAQPSGVSGPQAKATGAEKKTPVAEVRADPPAPSPPKETQVQPPPAIEGGPGNDAMDEPIPAQDESIDAEQRLDEILLKAPADLKDLLGRVESLVKENRYVEAFRLGVDAFGERCEESLVNACICVSRMASRWDREERIAPYTLFDSFDALAAGFGKHVREMRHIDPDPLRATSGLYRLANKIYTAWVDHCAAILEHQHKRTNTLWIQVDWVPPHKFYCLLNVMRSAVRIKLPLDLLLRIYQQLRQAISIGKSAIALDVRKVKFEGDCLRVLASPSKDVIPDLCYIIYRDIIDTYVQAGENAAALMFCEQALLIRRGDHEVEQIRADIIAKSGQRAPLRPRTTSQHRLNSS